MTQSDQEEQTKVGPAIGIDLGTTYSAVACVDESRNPYSIINQDGDVLTPTAVLIDDNDIVVGREAVNASVMEPDCYADCFKRDIGSMVFRRGVHGVQLPPQVLSAFVLQQLKKDAERLLGPITQAVITVPAFFDEARRKATQDAGRLAGLEVLDIINEPTAAALAYGFKQGFLSIDGRSGQEETTRVLVYDLGGGTFDVTILDVSGSVYRAVATDGDVQLGGKDFDERIVEYLAERFIGDHGIDPRSDPRDAAQLWMDAQKLKHALSKRSKSSAVVFHAGVRSNVELTRDKFERLTCDLLERTETTTSLVVRESGLTWDQIDRVLLVGGSSRMPAVAEMLKRLTGKDVDCSLSPDEAVARHGAALHAAILTRKGESAFANCQLINVNSHSLGIAGIDNQTGRRVNAIMIPKNTPLPEKQTRTFTTSEKDQRSVKIRVLEGESHRPDDCIQLGTCVIRDLPAGLPKGSKVEVTYRYETDGRVRVAARMPATRQSTRVEIERNNAADLEDLESWRQRLLSLQQDSISGTAAIDSGTALRRLDELYAKIGNAAVRRAAPDSLTRSQSAAQKMMAAYRAADAAYKKAIAGKDDTSSRTELVRASAQIAACKAKLERTDSHAKFACIVFGRECVKHNHIPSAVADAAAEVASLREQYGA